MARQQSKKTDKSKKPAREFEEIGRPGWRVELVRENDEVTGIKISGEGGGIRLFQLRASLTGELREIVHFQGFMPNGLPPDPLVPVYMVSDVEGLFGRTCPECKSYFRTNNTVEDTICPYCRHYNHCLAFTTPNQQEYVKKYCELINKAVEEGIDLVFDLNQIVDELPENRPQWVYTEERQQNLFTCQNCGTIVDILGDYGGCPRCGRLNYSEVIEAKLDELENQLILVDENVTDRGEREVEWEKLLRNVSEFEALANDVRKQLLRIPATPRRKADLGYLSFQNIMHANDIINNWFGFEILKGIADDDRLFMNKMFNRRHVFTHKAGIVDQEYLDNTGDGSVKLNQKIRLRSREIKRLLPLVRQAAMNLIEGYESIS